MKMQQRLAGILFLLTLFISSSVLLAQDNNTITAVGSQVAAPVFEALVSASGSDGVITTNITGTSGGFELFCQGQADITNATRSITADEDAACSTNTIDYMELLVAHDIVAFVANPGADYAQCLTSDNLNFIFAPSTQAANWNQVNPAFPDTALAVFVPPDNTATYAVLDSVIKGDGIRTEAAVQTTDQAVLDAVSQTNGALGVVSYAAAAAAGDAVRILSVNVGDIAGCTPPSAENVENRLYTATSPLLMYVNRASLSKPGLEALVNFIATDQAATVVAAQGLTPPTAQAYTTNQEIVAGTAAGRQFSSTSPTYEISPSISGQVTIAGSTNARDYITNLTGSFTAQYQGVTFDTKLKGQPEGVRRLCNGNLDIAVTETGLTDEEVQNCTANNITTFSVDLGHEAVVLVANASSPYLTCLAKEQLATIWNASSAKTITTWNQVKSDFPAAPMMLFAPSEGNSYGDLLMAKTAGGNVPLRDDTQMQDDSHRDDPLYRAAATANVDGALTFMSWPEYQRVLANNQERIQLVAVDAGNGCVAPSAETIADGSYPLTRTAQLVVNQKAAARPEVQAILWYLASDQNYSLFEQAGLLGVAFGELPLLRDTLQQAYKDAEAAVFAAAEATPEPGVEVTPEATSEATSPAVEATAETTPAS